MRNHAGFSFATLALLAPMAMANGGEDLDKVHIPALQDIKVSAKMGKGVTFDAGDDFSMNISGRLQVQWGYSALDNNVQDVTSFRVRRARAKIHGHMFSPKTEYMLYLEFASTGASTNNMLDVYISQELWSNDDWMLKGRAGNMKTLYGKEATGTSGGLEFVERSLAARTFSDNRVTGALFQLAGMEKKLHVHAGIFNTSTAAGSAFAAGAGTINPDNELNYTLGARYDLNGDMGGESYTQGDLDRKQEWNLSFHGNLWLGNEAGVATPDNEIFAFNLGAAFKGSGVHGLVEYFSHSSEPDVSGSTSADSSGFNAQASYTLMEGWGFGIRYSMVTIDSGGTQVILPASSGVTGGGTVFLGPGDVSELSFGVSKYFDGHGRKVQADVTLQSVDPDTGTDADNIIVRVMATLAI